MKIASRRSKRCQINCPFDWAICPRVRQDAIFFLLKYSDESYDDSVHRASLVSLETLDVEPFAPAYPLHFAFSLLSSRVRVFFLFVLVNVPTEPWYETKEREEKDDKGRRFAQSYRT